MTGEELSLRREESLKLLEGFRLIDDDFMTAFFEDDIPCTELVLRIVLDMPKLTVEEVHTQVHSSNLPEDRALRMDVLGRGLPVYKIERCILDLDELFGDGAHILYVNGSYRGDTPVGRLMHDFFCTRGEDMHYGVLAKRMDYFKKTNEGSGNMCKAMEDLMRRKDLRTARELMAMGKFTLEEATNFFDLSLEEVQQLEKEMASCPER